MFHRAYPIHRAIDNPTIKVAADRKFTQTGNRQVNDLLDGILDCCFQFSGYRHSLSYREAHPIFRRAPPQKAALAAQWK